VIFVINDNDASRKIKEDKYKILRMSLILGNTVNDKESLDDFETSAREIDAMNQETYLDDLDSKYYDTLSLEEESKRLEDLVSFVEGRLAQRKALQEDFYNVAGYSLNDLDSIKDEDRIYEYKNRLQYIDRYLNNMKVIEQTTKDMKEYQEDLDKAYSNKDISEENNIKLEKDLADLFKKIVSDDSIILRNTQEIDQELNEINPNILESKKTLDIFNKSFNTLKKAGISGREEKEYYSYVTNARIDYYSKMERFFLLSLYRLIFVINNEFEDIYNKRNKIKEILDDRTSLRANLEVVEDDRLSKLYNLLNQQYDIIMEEEENIKNIGILKEKINNCQEELSNYEEDNQRPEILTLLKEFCLIDKENDNIVDDSKIVSNDAIDAYDLKEDKEDKYLDNEVVEVREPISLDIIKVSEKAKNVMLRVGNMLNPEINSEKKNTEEITEPKIEEEPVVSPIEEINNIELNSNEEINLPSFDDLPTVSSLTSQGNIKPIESEKPSIVNNSGMTSFWGDNGNDFEFPDINNWGDN
jgi:hypothetical protein